jgi:hypothetical protein
MGRASRRSSGPYTFNRCWRELLLLVAETGAERESALASACLGVTGTPSASDGAQQRARLIWMNSSRPAVMKNCRRAHRHHCIACSNSK